MNRRSLLRAVAAGAVVGCAKHPHFLLPDLSSEALDWMAVEALRSFATNFALLPDEEGEFLASLRTYHRVHGRRGHPDRKDLMRASQALARQETQATFARLKGAIHGEPSDQLGHRAIRWEPVEGRRYVIFSDHHITYRGHRHAFFQQAGNVGLYAAALQGYHRDGWVLVENGDVEELVIYDPRWEPGEAGLRAELDLDRLVARRLEVRRRQLRKIYEDPANAPWVEALRAFDGTRRLIRVAGNHDYDLQRGDFLQMVRRYLPNLDPPADYLLLHRRSPSDADVAYAVMHGHQFDQATNPVSAPSTGEVISECLGLYFQGPDRTWSWHDCWPWFSGQQRLTNHLAHDRADWTEDGLSHQAVSQARQEEHHDARQRRRDEREGKSFRELMVRPYRDFTFGLAQSGFFERLFRHSIAWEYFLNDAPANAIRYEVAPGTRFFKFRHLDEEFICEGLENTFPDPAERPVLVLGHSHEPRHHAFSTRRGEPFRHYLNSAAAGRFENLIWAIEIDDGEATLVSWCLLPPPHGPATRYVWRPDERGQLVPEA